MELLALEVAKLLLAQPVVLQDRSHVHAPATVAVVATVATATAVAVAAAFAAAATTSTATATAKSTTVPGQATSAAARPAGRVGELVALLNEAAAHENAVERLPGSAVGAGDELHGLAVPDDGADAAARLPRLLPALLHQRDVGVGLLPVNGRVDVALAQPMAHHDQPPRPAVVPHRRFVPVEQRQQRLIREAVERRGGGE